MFENLPATVVEMKTAVLSEVVAGLKLNTFIDNFDKNRFNTDRVDNSLIFNTSERVYWISWFFENLEKIYIGYSLLATDKAKVRYLSIIAYRLAGHHSIKISTSFPVSQADYSNYIATEKYTPSLLNTSGAFGVLRHYDFEFGPNRYIVDCLGLEAYLFRNQYYFDEDDVQIRPVMNDYVIDAGACLGDTSVVFGKSVGSEGAVFAFDPILDHLDVLRHNANQNPDCRIFPMPYGLGDKDIDADSIRVGQYLPGFNSSATTVPMRALDTLIIEGKIPKVNYIKMDIEGAEMSALIGSMGTIRHFKPKLALSLYHKPDDLFEIPTFIKKHFPFYSLRIGHYTIHNEETVLYCS